MSIEAKKLFFNLNCKYVKIKLKKMLRMKGSAIAKDIFPLNSM